MPNLRIPICMPIIRRTGKLSTWPKAWWDMTRIRSSLPMAGTWLGKVWNGKAMKRIKSVSMSWIWPPEKKMISAKVSTRTQKAWNGETIIPSGLSPTGMLPMKFTLWIFRPEESPNIPMEFTIILPWFRPEKCYLPPKCLWVSRPKSTKWIRLQAKTRNYHLSINLFWTNWLWEK